jgi:peptidoglycan/LPS O-acetylase OafA/YrhL
MWEAAQQRRQTNLQRHEREPGLAGGDGWRQEAMGLSGLNVLAGIWLIISPFVLGYTGDDAVWNPIVFGAIAGLIALARLWGAYRESWLAWINAAIGVWLFVSGFWLADSSQASWNVWILGVVVFVLAVWSATAGEAAKADRPS